MTTALNPIESIELFSKCGHSRVAHCPVLFVMLSAVGVLAGAPLHAAGGGDGEPAASRLVDPQDGWLDVSGFLDSVYGFVPVIVPITEPAVGYGAAGALVFIDRKPPDSEGRYQRPNITAVGGLRTENGTHGVFAGHLVHAELSALSCIDPRCSFRGSPGARGRE